MFFNPSLNWGNFKIILLIDLKFWYPDEPLFASTIFFSSFASNLLYLLVELPRQSMLPTFLDKDFREGQGWDVPLDETQAGGINLKLTNKMRHSSCLHILHPNCSTSYIIRCIAYMAIWHSKITHLTSRMEMMTDYSCWLYDLSSMFWQSNEDYFGSFMECHCGLEIAKPMKLMTIVWHQ